MHTEVQLHPTFDQISEEHDAMQVPPVPAGDEPLVDFETSGRGTRQRRRSQSSASSRARQTTTVLYQALEETHGIGLLVTHQLTKQSKRLWYDYAQPLWLPFLGLATLGSAFTVPIWLSILDILVGVILIHIRCWQDWVRITCSRGGRTCTLPMIERAFAVAAVVLGCIALLYRVAFSAAGHFAAFDLGFIIFSLGGAGSAWCKPPAAVAPRLREVPGFPLLLLFLAIATLAPVPGVASLPYLLLFLIFLVLMVRRSGLGTFSFTARLCLLVLTTSHLVTLLVLSFWGSGAPPDLVTAFGRVGRVVSSKYGLSLCTVSADNRDPLGACGPGGTDYFWPGVHVSCLMLLHFVLTNVSAREKPPERPERRTTSSDFSERKSGGSGTDLPSRDQAGVKVWTKLALRWGIFVNLVVMVVWFPCLMTLPLLLMSFSLTVEKEGLLRSCPGVCCLQPVMRCFGWVLCCRCRRRSVACDATGNQVDDYKGRYVCFFMAFQFVVKYLFNIMREELPGRPGLYLWLNSKLQLQKSVPVDEIRRSWLEVIGLEYHGGGPADAASAFFPQAVILTIAVSLESILANPEIPRQRWCQHIGNSLERAWCFMAKVNFPEVSMVIVLILSTIILECEEGRASVFMVSYIGILVGIMLCRSIIRPQLWLLLQYVAELGSVVLMLVYVVTAPNMELPFPFDNCITVKCGRLPAIVAPHLGIALTAGLQRLLLRQAAEAPEEGPRRRISTADTMNDVGVESLPVETRTPSKENSYWKLYRWLDQRAVRRLKLFLEEIIVLSVMILALVTTLLPPVDVHSMLLLLVVGPALLIYNLEDDRERLLLRVNYLLQAMTAFFLLSRAVTASPLVPLPSDKGWPLNLQELGIDRPMDFPMKMVFLGLVTVLTKVAMKEAKAAIQENDALEKELAAELAEGSRPVRPPSSHMRPGMIAPPAGDVLPSPDAPRPQLASSPTFEVFDGDPEDIHASAPPDFMIDTMQHGDGLAMENGDEGVRPTYRPTFFGRPGRKPSLKRSESGSSANLLKKKRRDRRRSVGPRWEEKLLRKLVPGWMPHQPHAYLSALLLIVSFAVSITEVHLLNFLMILAVVSLCGWYELWVQAGNVFSFTTVVIMLLQYVARFHLWDGIIKESWMKVIGLQWSSNQVVRHCSILVLCFLQKQLWHRGRYSKPRPPTCPRWLSRHADLVGMAALLLVAVARRHFLSPLLAFAALPWLVREEWEDIKGFSWFFMPGQRMTRSWLRFFRLILLLTLLGQVLMRLVEEFDMQDEFNLFFGWSCSMWEADITTGTRAKMEAARAVARAECVTEWRQYLIMADSVGAKLLWEFLALFFLGIVQQLFERIEDADAETVAMKPWKLKAMHWWPVVVYVLTFALSLEGGTILGLIFLLLLIGVAFSSTKSLSQRRRWVWRTQLAAWVFLFAGLTMQSPMLPCGRASCHGQVHRTFIPIDRCVYLQNLNITVVETESRTAQCGTEAEALGHDTFLTLMVQIGGLRRHAGSSFWEAVGVLLGSQLGVLLQLILVASVQIRIFNSTAYRQQVDEHFLSEPEALHIERARRYVHEFYCRCRLEQMASRERRRALRDKLKRVMNKINDILSGRRPTNRLGNVMEEARRDILVEELQLSHGVKKEVAREVTDIFEKDMSLSKAYLDVLHLVTLGRLQPDGDRLHRQFQRLQFYLNKERISSASKKALGTAKQMVARVSAASSSVSDMEAGERSTAMRRSGSTRAYTAGKNKTYAQWRYFVFRTKDIWKKVQDRWEQLKEGRIIASCMNDYAFIGTNETSFCLRPVFEVATEELDRHRQANGPLRVLWKMALSNMASIVAVASVLAFVETRSILDLIRTFLVFFVAVQKYPFPPKEFWKGLLAFNVGVLVFRTFYDLPIFCAGPSLRTINSGLAWEPRSSVKWCPAVTEIGYDIFLGFAKRRGASAINQTPWLTATWADHLCVWTVLLHQWMLMRSGLWDHVAYDADNKQIWISTRGKLQISTRFNHSDNDDAPLARADRTKRNNNLSAQRVPYSSTQVMLRRQRDKGEAAIDRRHAKLVKESANVREGFLTEYYEMLEKERARQQAIAARRNSAGEAETRAVASDSEAALSGPDSEASMSPVTASEAEGKEGQTSDRGLPRMPRGYSSSGYGSHGPSTLMRGMHRARRRLRVGVPSWLTGEHGHMPGESSAALYHYMLSGADMEVRERVRKLVQIQNAVRRFLERMRKHRRIRCLMGHPLLRDKPVALPRSPIRKAPIDPEMLHDLQVCERCNQVIRSTLRYSCKECDYHACNECVQTLLALDQGMGKQDQLSARTTERPGIRIYWLKYLIGLVLLTYFLLANSAIFKSEARSALESVQANNISSQTLSLLTVHLMLLICDRIFHKWHYRNSSSTGSLKIMDALNVILLLAEFFWVHLFIVIELKSAANPREQVIALHSELALCTYYIGWMLYIGVCLTQRKYGLPAVDHDTLRPTAPPDSMGIWIEKIHTFSWYAHYALPFVDDLRVIIDWSVMPTSLDLWMHFKVEDAHSWLFRTRHAMYVRRQSFFAEQRDACEKVYSGWLIVFLLLFIILMPLLVFSPITPFPNSVPIESGRMVLSFGVATGCDDGPMKMKCRSEKIQLYQAHASQILTYNSSQRAKYLNNNPRAPTDIDIQEVLYPTDSRVPLEVSPPVGLDVQALLDAQMQSGVPVMALFESELSLVRTNNMPSFQTQHVVCFCAPQDSCHRASWPPAVGKACAGSITGSNSRLHELRLWWHALGRGDSYSMGGNLPQLWEANVRVGTGTPVLLQNLYDVSVGLNNCSAQCNSSWCSGVHCFGRVEPIGRDDATVTYEMERSAMLNTLASSNGTSFSVVGLYIAVVLVAGRYLRAAFQDSSKRAIYEEIPDVSAFLDLVTAIKLAREHRDLRTEFQLYYCLMKVLRSTNLLLTTGGHEPSKYGAGRSDEPPPECEEPRPEQKLDQRHARMDYPSEGEELVEESALVSSATSSNGRTFTL